MINRKLEERLEKKWGTWHAMLDCVNFYCNVGIPYLSHQTFEPFDVSHRLCGKDVGPVNTLFRERLASFGFEIQIHAVPPVRGVKGDGVFIRHGTTWRAGHTQRGIRRRVASHGLESIPTVGDGIKLDREGGG